VKTKKYWLMTSEFPPFHGGGISTYMYHTAKMLENNGYDVTIFFFDNSYKDSENLFKIDEDTTNNYRVVRFNPFSYKNRISFLGGTACVSYYFSKIVKEFISKEGYPLTLESHEYNAIAYHILQEKNCLDTVFEKLHVTISLHCPHFIAAGNNEAPLYELPTYWTSQLERSVINSADTLFAPSNYLVSRLKEENVLGLERATVMRNPFNLSSISNKTSSQVKTYKKFYYLGKLQYAKGIFDLLEAFKIGWENGNTDKIHLIGPDSIHLPLDQSIKDLIIKKYGEYLSKNLIVFEGSLPPEAVMAKLTDAKALIVPSHFEAFPYTVVEAMSKGIPVIASNSGGHSELIIDNKTGFLHISKCPKSLHEKINHVNNLNELELKSIGDNAILRVNDLCSYKSIIDKKISAIRTKVKEKTSFPFITDLSHRQKATNNDKDSFKSDTLSIVVPYFNMENFVDETIQSIRDQLIENYEIIIVNDGSTSTKSHEKLKQLESCRDVIVIHKNNAGLAEARNTGIKHANGEFIAYLDPDDMIKPGYYKQAISIMKKYDNVDFISTSAQYFGESEAIWPTWNPEPPYILIHNSVVSSALVFKRNALLNFGLNDSEMKYGMEDYEVVVKLLSNGIRGVAIPETNFLYRVRKESMSRAFNRNNVLYLYSLIAKKHKSLFSEFGYEVSNLLNANGPGFMFDNPSFGPRR